MIMSDIDNYSILNHLKVYITVIIMTYLKRILAVLDTDRKSQMDVPKILEEIGAFRCKMCYVIDALKRGIREGKIVRIDNPNTKTLYKYHFYILNDVME